MPRPHYAREIETAVGASNVLRPNQAKDIWKLRNHRRQKHFDAPLRIRDDYMESLAPKLKLLRFEEALWKGPF